MDKLFFFKGVVLIGDLLQKNSSINVCKYYIYWIAFMLLFDNLIHLYYFILQIYVKN